MQTRSPRPRTRMRIGAVLAATASALIAWSAISPLGGVDLVVPTGTTTRTVDALDVAFAAVLSGVAGWCVAALLQRRADRPRRTWLATATTVFVLSLTGPLTSGAAASVPGSLVALHAVVAAVVIPQLARTLPAGPVRVGRAAPARS